jgi:hypothetical protein
MTYLMNRLLFYLDWDPEYVPDKKLSPPRAHFCNSSALSDEDLSRNLFAAVQMCVDSHCPGAVSVVTCSLSGSCIPGEGPWTQ